MLVFAQLFSEKQARAHTFYVSIHCSVHISKDNWAKLNTAKKGHSAKLSSAVTLDPSRIAEIMTQPPPIKTFDMSL